MGTIQDRLGETNERSAKVAQVLQRRVQIAQDRFKERVAKAGQMAPIAAAGPSASAWTPWSFWTDLTQYSVDAAQRSVLLLVHS